MRGAVARPIRKLGKGASHALDREQLDAPLLGVELANALRRLHGRTFRLDDTLASIGSRSVVRAIDQGEDPRRIALGWQEQLGSFLTVRRKYLLYR